MAPITRPKKPSPAQPSAPAGAQLRLSDPVKAVELLLFDRTYLPLLAGLLLLGEVVLSSLVIRFIPYTEIDWTTYVQQIDSFIGGERDYTRIEGSTGPVVYPAGFVWFYSALYFLTQRGTNILRAQVIFAAIYIATQGVVFSIYARCKSVPPYALILLTLSKRLHSIYMLRMFNDGVGMLFFYGAVWCWTCSRPRWNAGCVLFSLALSIKMNFLLYLPALAYLLLTSLGALPSLLPLSCLALPQVLLALPFIQSREGLASYTSRAFDFSREFEWKWTVNWRWLGEEAFRKRELAGGLVVLHVMGLVCLALAWNAREGGLTSVVERGLRRPTKPAGLGQPSADRVVMILFTANVLGIVCARSLHYQFYAWYAHQIPFLLWQCPFDLVRRAAIIGAIEWAWNVFPSTERSSLTLTIANCVLVVGAITCGSEEAAQFVGPVRGVELDSGMEEKKQK